jgi:hypothetical protein
LAGAVRITIAVAFVLTVGGLGVGAWSLVVRFRHARGVERQQLRWIAFAGALTGVAAAVVLSGMALGATAVLLLAAGVCLAILPLATGAAILRYRLYDLDRIISRTLAYGLLTVLLGGGYAGIVLGLGQLLGRSSSLAVAVATLAVAGAFSRPAAGRAAWHGRADHAADQRVAVASTLGQCVPRAARHRRIPRGVTADGSFAVRSCRFVKPARTRQRLPVGDR